MVLLGWLISEDGLDGDCWGRLVLGVVFGGLLMGWWMVLGLVCWVLTWWFWSGIVC